VGHGGQPEARVGDALHLAIRGVTQDLVHAPAALVPCAEHGRIAIGLGRETFQLVAGDAPHLDQVGSRTAEVRVGHHVAADELEIRVREVEVAVRESEPARLRDQVDAPDAVRGRGRQIELGEHSENLLHGDSTR